MVAVGLLDNWITAEVKIQVPGVAARPAAGVGGERADLFRGGQARIDEGGCLGARQGQLFRRRLARKESGRLKSGAAVCPGGLLDLGGRNRPGSQEAKDDSDAVWNPAITRSPATDVPQSDAEQLGDVLLRDAERAKHLAEFNRSRVA
jgi:hypothetical protein